MPFIKNNVTHEDMIVGADWLQQNYGAESYAIVNHPSRKNLWHVGDFRALNDAAPDVCFGFEGMPGHQAAVNRGEYGNTIAADGKVTTDPALADPTLTSHARTYGGADWMTATVGGLWDALLGEGRNWWVFNNSDYHVINTSYKDAAGTTIGLEYKDFWPGQYAKTYTYVNEDDRRRPWSTACAPATCSSSTATSSTVSSSRSATARAPPAWAAH